jgi:chromosome segregation ATPase
LTIDNSNKRLPVATNEVVLMRRWNKDNKDEYFINGK